MLYVCIVSFLLMFVGMFLVFGLTPSSLSEDAKGLAEDFKTTDISKIAKRTQSTKKQSAISRFFNETYQIMEYMDATGKFFILLLICFGLAGTGSIIVASLNVYCIPAVVLGCLSIPFLYIHKISYNYARAIMKELETTLSQVTNSYIRTELIYESVEENLGLMNQPVKKYFVEFLNQLKYVDSNEKQAIEDLSKKIDDNVFKEWCDGFAKCSTNRTLKYLLNPSIEKYTTIKNLDSQIKREIFEIKFSFFIVVGLVYLNYPILYLLNKEWFSVLTSTTLGLITTGILTFVTVLCFIILFFITKPIKYKI